MPSILLLHAQHNMLVRNSSVLYTLQHCPSLRRRDTVGVLGLPLQQLLLKLASPYAKPVLLSFLQISLQMTVYAC